MSSYRYYVDVKNIFVEIKAFQRQTETDGELERAAYQAFSKNELVCYPTLNKVYKKYMSVLPGYWSCLNHY